MSSHFSSPDHFHGHHEERTIRHYNRNALGRVQRRFAHNANAYRSGLEEKIAGQIEAQGVKVLFESFKLAYKVPSRDATYTPDLLLPNGIIIETKGLFQSDDRKKMKLIKEQHPDLDIRFIFSNANAKIAKQSKTTYAKWADTNGFPWAHRDCPKTWLEEPNNQRSLSALKESAICKKPN